MDILETSISPKDPQFLENKNHYRGLAHTLRECLVEVRLGGGEKYRKRHESQGKLFVRDRIERLLMPLKSAPDNRSLHPHRGSA